MKQAGSRLFLAGCAGFLVAGTVFAQVVKSPAAPRPAAAATAPAAARDPLAVKNTFQTVMTELDQGGDLLVVMNVDGAVQELMEFVTKIVSTIPMEAKEAAETRQTIAKLKTFLMKNGFYAANGVGVSSVPVGGGMSTIKMFVSRDPAASGLPLWRIVGGGEPRKQVTLDFLPSDTAMFRIVDVRPSDVLQLVKSGVNGVASAETVAAFSNGLAGASGALGASVEQLLGSIGDEICVSVRLSTQSKVVLPAKGKDKLEIPEPSLLVGFKVNDDSIMKLITTQLTKMEIPVVESKVGTTVLVTVNGLPPSPVPFQPTFAVHGGCFLAGSNPKAVADAVNAFNQKNGFAAGAEFKKAFRDLPAANNGMAFVSPRVFEVIGTIQARLAKSGGPEAPEMAMFQSMFDDLLKGGKEAIALVSLNKKTGVLLQGTMPGAGSKLVAGMTLAPTASIGMLAAIAVPSFVKARNNARGSSCINNLRQIDAAKDMFALEKGGTNGMAVTWDDISPYIKDAPGRCFCPSAAPADRSLKNYRLGAIGEEPACLVDPRHTLGGRR